MSVFPVLKNPSKELRKKSEEIEVQEIVSGDVKKLIDDLIETMKDENGIGIAAPQIGVHKRVIIIDSEKKVEVYINPRIVSKSFGKEEGEEGCLSVPGIWGMVKRHKKVEVHAYNRNGEPVTIKAEGLLSTILQHEIDHLDGVLFIDKVVRYTTPHKM